MLYETHYKEGKKVFFKKFDLKIAGLLFLPDNFDESKKYPAIVVTHPGRRSKRAVLVSIRMESCAERIRCACI